jgi:O-antigen/teichoic acid export membrane protein
MAGIRSLLKDSAIYGGSTMLVRSVNWLVTTLLTYALLKSEFGIMNYLYAYTALFLVILTFGMETGFFRFAGQVDRNRTDTVYSTVLILVGGGVVVFLTFFLLFLPQLHPLLWNREAPIECVRLILIIVALDAFSAIPFARLRYRKQPVRFGLLKILYIALYTVFCTFFLAVCPEIHERSPGAIEWFWREDFRLEYVFISNLLATGIQTLFLLPELTGFRYRFDAGLAKKMLRYCFPLMLMGVVGVSSLIVDKIVFPLVYSDPEAWSSEAGVYNACFRIAMVMMMFTQAFRYAYDPFVFEKSREKSAHQSYADVMKYFIILGLIVCLGVVFYLDIIKYFIPPTYFGALDIVPIVLMGEFCFAIYFNLSIWYKLSDKTHWGALFSLIGFALTLTINLLFIPAHSYHACAWASLIGNGTIMLLSYFIGQRKYPIRYDLRSAAFYFVFALALYIVSHLVPIDDDGSHVAFNTLLMVVFIAVALKRDLPLKKLLRSRKKNLR